MPIFKLENTKLVIAQETNIKHEEILEDWFENSHSFRMNTFFGLADRRVPKMKKALYFRIYWVLI